MITITQADREALAAALARNAMPPCDLALAAWREVRVPIVDANGVEVAYLHRRLVAVSEAQAVALALAEYSSEDLFGVRFGKSEVRALGAAT